jgi:hypothetical protein
VSDKGLDFLRAGSGRKANKYHVAAALDRTINGIRFDSRAEMQRYLELRMLERAGQIRDLERQVDYILVPKHVRKDGEKCLGIVYRADFRYLDLRTNRIIVEDVKGALTAAYRIKRTLLLYQNPDLNFVEVRG